MKNVYIYCEGQTEESFVNELLYPYFLNKGIYVSPIVCTTKRTTTQKFRGGVSTYGKIKKELITLCRSHKNEFVTTMFDYYAMPEDTPGLEYRSQNIFDQIGYMETKIDCDIDQQNCKFHLMLHEFESLLFPKPEAFRLIADESVVNGIKKIRDCFETPEHINNSAETAPSKRIEKLIPHYAKIRNGTILAKDIGMDVIQAQCPHFKKWISEILDL